MILRSTARVWLRMILRSTAREWFGDNDRLTAGVSVNMILISLDLRTHSCVSDLSN